MIRTRRILALASTVIAFGACDFTSFETFRTHAPIISFLAPDSLPSNRYGGLIAVASDALQNDWLVVSDGLGTPVSIQPIRVGDAVAPRMPVADIFCAGASDCGGGGALRYGIGLGGNDAWGDGTICAMTGSYGGIHSVHVRCLGPSTPREAIISPPGGLEMAGFGLAIGTPRRHRRSDPAERDLAFIGAPAGGGHIVVSTPTTSVDITPPLNNVSAIGSAIAVGRFVASDGTHDLLLVAGSTSGQVLVMHGDPRAGRAMQPLGCLLQTEPGFGLAVATADLDGDGSDEIAVGAGSENAGRMDVVHVYSTANAPGGTTCDTSWTERFPIRCANATDRDVTCEGFSSGFGASIAGGDVDADGRDELFIGAQNATVHSVTRAGAVFVYRGAGAGASLSVTRATVLRDQEPQTDYLLGHEVRVALIGTREEPLVAVPGQPAVRMFACTGLDGDRPMASGLSEECR